MGQHLRANVWLSLCGCQRAELSFWWAWESLRGPERLGRAFMTRRGEEWVETEWELQSTLLKKQPSKVVVIMLTPLWHIAGGSGLGQDLWKVGIRILTTWLTQKRTPNAGVWMYLGLHPASFIGLPALWPWSCLVLDLQGSICEMGISRSTP